MDCSIPRHSTLQHSCFVSCQSVVTRIQIAYSGKFAGAKAKTNTPIFFGGRWYWRYSCSITRLGTYFSSDELRNILPPVSGETVLTPCARSLPSPIITFTIIPIQSPYCDCVLIVISVAKGCASWRNSLPIPSVCNNIGSSQLTALLPGGGFINELVANQLKLPWDLPRWSKMEKQISPHSRVMCPIDISTYCPISQQCQIKIELGTIRSCLCYGGSSPPPRRELCFKCFEAKSHNVPTPTNDSTLVWKQEVFETSGLQLRAWYHHLDVIL